MKLWAVIATAPYDSGMEFVGVFSSLEKAEEAKLKYETTGKTGFFLYSIVDIYETVLDQNRD